MLNLIKVMKKDNRFMFGYYLSQIERVNVEVKGKFEEVI
jgi:hypothetical protein